MSRCRPSIRQCPLSMLCSNSSTDEPGAGRRHRRRCNRRFSVVPVSVYPGLAVGYANALIGQPGFHAHFGSGLSYHQPSIAAGRSNLALAPRARFDVATCVMSPNGAGKREGGSGVWGGETGASGSLSPRIAATDCLGERFVIASIHVVVDSCCS